MDLHDLGMELRPESHRELDGQHELEIPVCSYFQLDGKNERELGRNAVAYVASSKIDMRHEKRTA